MIHFILLRQPSKIADGSSRKSPRPDWLQGFWNTFTRTTGDLVATSDKEMTQETRELITRYRPLRLRGVFAVTSVKRKLREEKQWRND